MQVTNHPSASSPNFGNPVPLVDNAVDLDAYLKQWRPLIIKTVGRDNVDDFNGFVWVECFSKKLTTVDLKVLFYAYFKQADSRASMLSSSATEEKPDPFGMVSSHDTPSSGGYAIKSTLVDPTGVNPVFTIDTETFDDERKATLLRGYFRRSLFIIELEKLNIINQCKVILNEIYVKFNNGEDYKDFFKIGPNQRVNSSLIRKEQVVLSNRVIEQLTLEKDKEINIGKFTDEQYRFIDATSYALTVKELSSVMRVNEDTIRRIDSELSLAGFVPFSRGTCTYFELAGIGLEDRADLYVIAMAYLGFSTADISSRIKIPESIVEESLGKSNSHMRFLTLKLDNLAEVNPELKGILENKKFHFLRALDRRAVKHEVISRAPQEEQLAYILHEAYAKASTCKNFNEFLVSENTGPEKVDTIIKCKRRLTNRISKYTAKVPDKDYSGVYISGRQYQFLELHFCGFQVNAIADVLAITPEHSQRISAEIGNLGFPAISGNTQTYLEKVGIGSKKRESLYVMAMAESGFTVKEIAKKLNISRTQVVNLTYVGRTALGQTSDKTLQTATDDITYNFIPDDSIPFDGWSKLQPSQKKYFTLACRGLSFKEVALQCGVAKGTVSESISTSLKILGLKNVPGKEKVDTDPNKDAPMPECLRGKARDLNIAEQAWGKLIGKYKEILSEIFNPCRLEANYAKATAIRLGITESAVKMAKSRFRELCNISPEEFDDLVNKTRDLSAISSAYRAAWGSLNQKQREIVLCLSEGLGDEEISRRMNLSLKSVYEYKRVIGLKVKEADELVTAL